MKKKNNQTNYYNSFNQQQLQQINTLHAINTRLLSFEVAQPIHKESNIKRVEKYFRNNLTSKLVSPLLVFNGQESLLQRLEINKP